MDKIDINKLKLIGKGVTSTCYLIDEHKIVKAYKPYYNYDQILIEQRNAQTLFKMGVKTPNAYEIVKTNNGYGLIFDYIKGNNLSECIINNPENLDKYVKKYVNLIRVFESLEMSEKMPLISERLNTILKEESPILKDDEIQILSDIIESIPVTSEYIHGDLNPKNILVCDDEFYVIDLCESCRGPFVVNMLTLHRVLYSVGTRSKFFAKKYIGIDSKMCVDLWYRIAKEYYQTDNHSDLLRITDLLNSTAAFFSYLIINAFGPIKARLLITFYYRKALMERDIKPNVEEIKSVLNDGIK